MKVKFNRHMTAGNDNYVPGNTVIVEETSLNWTLADAQKFERQGKVTILDDKPAKVAK